MLIKRAFVTEYSRRAFQGPRSRLRLWLSSSTKLYTARPLCLLRARVACSLLYWHSQLYFIKMQLKRLNFEVNNGGGGERWRHFTRRRKVGNTCDARRAASSSIIFAHSVIISNMAANSTEYLVLGI